MPRKSTTFSRTSSSAQTKALGARLARTLKPKKTGATLILLSGELGSGKTTFTQGFARGLGVMRVTSPTFVLMHRHPLRGRQFSNLYHIDCYRIKKAREFLAIGFREIVADPHNVVLIEWPEKIKAILPKDAIRITFHHGAKAYERTIRTQDLGFLHPTPIT